MAFILGLVWTTSYTARASVSGAHPYCGAFAIRISVSPGSSVEDISIFQSKWQTFISTQWHTNLNYSQAYDLSWSNVISSEQVSLQLQRFLESCILAVVTTAKQIPQLLRPQTLLLTWPIRDCHKNKQFNLKKANDATEDWMYLSGFPSTWTIL